PSGALGSNLMLGERSSGLCPGPGARTWSPLASPPKVRAMLSIEGSDPNEAECLLMSRSWLRDGDMRTSTVLIGAIAQMTCAIARAISPVPRHCPGFRGHEVCGLGDFRLFVRQPAYPLALIYGT